MTTWAGCGWKGGEILCPRWPPQRKGVADSSLHGVPPHPTTTRRKEGGAYFLTTTTVVQCMRRSPSSAQRTWDAATLFWEGRIAQRRLRSFSTGDGDSASDVRSLTTVDRHLPARLRLRHPGHRDPPNRALESDPASHRAVDDPAVPRRPPDRCTLPRPRTRSRRHLRAPG